MDREHWAAVDQYLGDLLIGHDEALDAALADSAAAGLPAINVSPPQGKMLHLLARLLNARHILEIGTLGGYSTIWLARALPPDGRLITLELDPHHAAVARRNLVRAGVADRVDLRVGPAMQSLEQLIAEVSGRDDFRGFRGFDLVFIDADKPNTPGYFELSMKLTRPGGLIIVDNVMRKGAVIDETSDDPNVKGMRRFLAMLAAEDRVDATSIQTVGSKGYDGFALAVVK